MQTTGSPTAFRECHSHGDVGPLSNPTLAARGAWVWMQAIKAAGSDGTSASIKTRPETFRTQTAVFWSETSKGVDHLRAARGVAAASSEAAADAALPRSLDPRDHLQASGAGVRRPFPGHRTEAGARQCRSAEPRLGYRRRRTAGRRPTFFPRGTLPDAAEPDLSGRHCSPRRLLEDIEASKVQIVVVYKVDRLTRSLADFAKIVDVLDAHNASFVSVTQQFNTTTSMGRLTLNMLLSFAQFEREIASERIRDKIAASKKKGMWMGGNVPLGYDVKDRKLIVNEPEASTVRVIFNCYAELGSVALLKAELDRLGLVSKRREGAGGRLAGGQRFSRGALYLMLQNRIYRGDIVYQGATYPGQHQAILDPELWQIVQGKLAANQQERALGVGAEAPSLLAGLIVDAGGNPMTSTHATKRAKRYRYYVSASLLAGITREPRKECAFQQAMSRRWCSTG
jgi:Resolvase, N terminal domain/Recombinase